MMTNMKNELSVRITDRVKMSGKEGNIYERRGYRYTDKQWTVDYGIMKTKEGRDQQGEERNRMWQNGTTPAQEPAVSVRGAGILNRQSTELEEDWGQGLDRRHDYCLNAGIGGEAEMGQKVEMGLEPGTDGT